MGGAAPTTAPRDHRQSAGRPKCANEQDQGEGGIFALLSLAFPESVTEAPKSRLTIAMIAVGLIGAALLYGDGVITPAMSVLSATEGLTVAPGGLLLLAFLSP